MRPARGAAGQRGWAGLVLLLIALVIGAFIAKEALTQYGVSRNATAVKSTSSANSQRAPAVDAPPADTSSAPSTASAPIERARAVEELIQRQADEQAKRMP